MWGSVAAMLKSTRSLRVTIRADLDAMYRAGKQEFPAHANRLGGLAGAMSEATSTWQTAAVMAESPAGLVDAIDLNIQVHHLLRQAVMTWNDAGQTIVSITDGYVEADKQAEAAARRLEDGLGTKPFQPAPVPPRLEENDR